MKAKLSFILIVLVISCLFMPILSGAAPVPWESGTYTAYAFSYLGTEDIQSSSSPPVNASSSVFQTNRGSASITDSSMFAQAAAFSESAFGIGRADFSGTYISQAAYTILMFSYSLEFLNNVYVCCPPTDNYAWLTVTDLTANNILYSESNLALSSNISNIYIDSLAGHTIFVDFGIQSHVDLQGEPATAGLYTGTLNYNMAIVPEPISSALFIIGGATLFGRRYFRREKIA